MPYLLDSDVLIDISRNGPEVIDYVDTLPDPWMISQVTAMELLVGARDKREVGYLHAFLSSYPIVPLPQDAKRQELTDTAHCGAPCRKSVAKTDDATIAVRLRSGL